MAGKNVTPMTPEQARQRRKRAIVTALLLAAAVAAIFVVTIVNLGPAVLDRPL